MGQAWASWEQSIAVIMQCSGQRILCIGPATWQNMEFLEHMLAKTSTSDLTVRWSARHHSETHTVMSSLIHRPSEMDHWHSRQSWDWLQNWYVKGKFYKLHQKLMRGYSRDESCIGLLQRHPLLEQCYCLAEAVTSALLPNPGDHGLVDCL